MHLRQLNQLNVLVVHALHTFITKTTKVVISSTVSIIEYVIISITYIFKII